jgi:hypothetical protein
MHSSEEGEKGTKQHECLPDDALSEESAESLEVFVLIVIISTREPPDVFLDLHKCLAQGEAFTKFCSFLVRGQMK